MDTLFEIALRISKPLALAGFLSAAFFLIAKQVIAKVPSIPKNDAMAVVRHVVDRLFVLALVAIALGSAGYGIDLWSSRRESPVVPSESGPSEQTIRGVVKANSAGYPPIANARIRIDDKEASTESKEGGLFELRLAAVKDESLFVQISAPGYADKSEWVTVGKSKTFYLDPLHPTQ